MKGYGSRRIISRLFGLVSALMLGACGAQEGGGEVRAQSVAMSPQSLEAAPKNLCVGGGRNETLEAGEECDGNSLPCGVCTEGCEVNLCAGGSADGVVENDGVSTFEECDPEDPASIVQCTATCHVDLCVGGQANGKVESGEECDPEADPEANPEGRCTQACRLNLCSGGYPDSIHITDWIYLGKHVAEGCDDGDKNNSDGCTNYCRISRCGDGFVQAANGEQCDDGNASDADKCLTKHEGEEPQKGCTWSTCGDGRTDPSAREECDLGEDNNSNTGDCTLSCLSAKCGDGYVWAGHEACDEGSNNSDAWSQNGHCNATCTGQAPHCGDGTQNGPEVCDDGPLNSDAWSPAKHCNGQCTGYASWCGDGVINGPEACDDGAHNGEYGKCKTDCTGIGPHCGDGEKNGAETCDEGANPKAQCDYSQQSCVLCVGCQSTPTAGRWCGDGKTTDGEECDNGPANDSSAPCTDQCKKAVCGDGRVCSSAGCSPVEQCDFGRDANGSNNNQDSAHCTSQCQWNVCGDGKVWTAAYGGPEECDEGADNRDERHCSATCKVNVCGDGKVWTSKYGGWEVCDDGALNGQPGRCRADCLGRCGDGLVNGNEYCDSGSGNGDGWAAGQHCNAGCTGWGPYCGDGSCDAAEQTDCTKCPQDCAYKMTCNDNNACTDNDQCQKTDAGIGVCVGAPKACPPTYGAWSGCHVSGNSCVGTHTRTVTNYTCQNGQCVVSTTSTESEACTQADGALCDTQYGPWSDCNYASTCAESATRTRTETLYSCHSGQCVVAGVLPQSEACSRDTDNWGCADTQYGAWSDCNYANACALSATQTRTVTPYSCQNGQCVPSPTTETTTCSRDTNGKTCADPYYGDWSSCSYADTCAQSGDSQQFVAYFTCQNGGCAWTSYDYVHAGCSRKTDNTDCGTEYGGWSTCAYPGTCAYNQTQSRWVTPHTCSGGQCLVGAAHTESQNCGSTRNTDGLGCGTSCRGDHCSNGFCLTGSRSCCSMQTCCECSDDGLRCLKPRPAGTQCP
jgi:cysteine-rich repeat protein